LAREAARNDVNTASPRLSVKGANVIPDREGRQNSFILSLDKYACGIWVLLDGADGSPPEEFSPEDSPACTCEECEFSKSAINARLISHAITHS
jgi:hypothetical protein